MDVVLAHGPDLDKSVEETLSGFGSLIQDGLAGGWGASNIDGPALTEWMETARRLGLPAPVFVENRYNLVQREAEQAVLPICREAGVEFLAYSPTASGLLTGKYRRGEPPPTGSMMALRSDLASDIDDRALDVIAVVTEVAAELHFSNVAVAFAWLMRQPGVFPIAGPSKARHMDAIEEALDLELSDIHTQRLSGF